MTEPVAKQDHSIDRPARLVLYTVFLIGSLAYTIEAATFHPLAKIAPQAVGVGASLLMFAALGQEIWRWRRSRRSDVEIERAGSIEATESDLTLDSLLPALKYVGLVAAYVVAITLVGFLLSSVVLLVALLRVGGGMRWLWITVSIASADRRALDVAGVRRIIFPDRHSGSGVALRPDSRSPLH